MSLPFARLDVLSNAPGASVFEWPMRVLDFVESDDVLWLIALPGCGGKFSSRIPTYLKNPVLHSLEEIRLQIESTMQIAASKFVSDPRLASTDDQIIALGRNDKERKQSRKMLDWRDRRWGLLLRLIADPQSQEPRSFLSLINDPGQPAAIAALAAETGTSRTTIQYLRNRYWALGSQKNAILTGHKNCGAPGKSKVQKTKLGRPNRLHKAGDPDSKGYVLSDIEDKMKLAWGYRLIKSGHAPNDAWLATSATHWAERTIDENGKLQTMLFPPLQRPSYEQFLYWGKLLNEDKSITDLILGDLKSNKKKSARGGSLQDQVVGVGQLGAFDATSCDVYLTSIFARQRKLPPMTRLVAQDVRSEIIYGLYCGWEPASPATALQAILHGASPKPPWCKRFGVEITEDEWPHFLARGIQADNGELKAAVPTQAEQQFGFSISYTPINSGDKKGGVEASHRSIHKDLDHKTPGTTKGKRTERGVEHAAISALWNYYEYMPELIHAILDFNNEERLELAPIEMLREVPPIKPTRLNIFLWLRKHGMSADIPVDLEAFRAFTLPDTKAVIRKNGVYIIGTVLGHDQILPRFRYTSPELVATGLMSRVKVSGSPIQTVVKMDHSVPDQAWLPTKAGMIPMRLADRDTVLCGQVTLTDWEDHLADRALDRARTRGSSEQKNWETLERRTAISNNARAELREENTRQTKPPSKTAIKRNLRSHRDQEIAALRLQDTQGKQHQAAAAPNPDIPAPSAIRVVARTPSAADLAMRKLNSEEFGDGS